MYKGIHIRLSIYILLAIILLTSSIYSTENPSNIQITKSLSSMPLAFTANVGQWDEQVQFRANAGGATMWFAPDGAYYQFTRTIESTDKPISVVDKRYGMEPEDVRPDSVETMMIKASFVDANPNPQMIGVDELEYKCNYFIGNDPNEWHTDVPNYSAVMYEQVYDGIDLKYYGNGKQMEYDFIVKPGADYSQIKIQYEGAESISVNEEGQLVVKTKWNEVIENRPVIYQLQNNERISVTGEYIFKGTHSFGFKLSEYNHELPLVIDPVLEYSTYLGGNGNDYGFGIAVDTSGATYLTGWTDSNDFPTLNPYNGSLKAGYDVFVTKFNSSGNSLVYSTYLGGSSSDMGDDITVNIIGEVFISGHLSSLDFPIVNPYSGTHQGDYYDGFIAKLSSSGNSLIYSTYLGGSSNDVTNSIAVNDLGEVYVTGWTESNDFPTLNPIIATYQGGEYDAFVTKLNSSGNGLIYSTYLSGRSNDIGSGIAVDTSGAVYVTGSTSSSDFPIQDPLFESNKGQDVFITKLSSSGNSLIYSTYLGGSSDYEGGNSISVDDSGAAYVVGSTHSIDFPVLNSFSETNMGGSDVFVIKIGSSGNSLVYSTYLGGSDYDIGRCVVVDSYGSAHITGSTDSPDFPILNPHQVNQGGKDVFYTKLSPIGDSMVYSTYLGGSSADEASCISIDYKSTLYISGHTWSYNFPTLNPYIGTHQDGNRDVFITKFRPSQLSCCIDPTGDPNNSGDVYPDVTDLLYLVDHFFADPFGPAPVCFEESDVDGSGILDINDLLYLVDFMFADPAGPAPVDCP